MRQLQARALVIGSGPGGAMTGLHLAEAGWDTLVVEEGDALALDSAEPYSLAEMDQKWRSGGLTPAFGPASLTYVEGRVVGGASEINAALYHEPVPEGLDGWARDYGIADFGARQLEPHVEWVEREVGVARFPNGPGTASARLQEGARVLGWKNREVARFWRYTPDGKGGYTGRRQSMTESLLPRATRAGMRLEPGIRIRHLRFSGDRAVEAVGRDKAGRPVRIRFESVFVCGGAIQTALILRRSGLRKHVGDTLALNPMVRIAARFDEVVNDPSLGVPVQQVEEFKPLMTLGCSHSSLAHLALWLVGPAAERERILSVWPTVGVFYAKVSGKSRGKVRNVPITDEAFVRYPTGKEDVANVAEALHRLGRLLFAAGAREIINPIPGEPPIGTLGELDELRRRLTAKNVQLSTIHLHSTVPMGRPERGGATDAFGKLYAASNVYVNDASLLPDTPGINPQGTILAIARRNIVRFLGG